ncbi:MAG: aspartate aminotransferase family protein [Thermomicrobiales bacterium]
MTDASLSSRDAALIADALKIRYNPMTIVRGEGCTLFDADGRSWLDFGAGWAVASLGYSHPRVVEAIQEQVSRTTFAGLISGLNEPALDLAQRLVDLMPGGFAKKVWFGHSGSDASEAAHRLVLAASGRKRVISFIGSWHGMTDSGQTLSGHPAFAGHLGSGHVTKLPYPNPVRNPFGGEPGQTLDQLFAYLESYLFATICPPEDIAAIFVESVQSDGGDIVPPDDFLPRLRSLCDRHGIWLVVDDVKVGLGRTGRFFSYEHSDIEADLVILGKALGGGLPLSALVGRREILDAGTGTALFTTVGSATCCAAGLAAVDAIVEEGLAEAAAERGAYLQHALRTAFANVREVAAVRGRGLIQGVELVTKNGEPNQPLAAAMVYRAWELGLILYYAGNWSNVLELTPPLIVTDGEIDHGVAILVQALDDTIHGRVDAAEVAEFAGW